MGNGHGVQNRSAAPMPAIFRIDRRPEHYSPPVRRHSMLICLADAETAALTDSPGRSFVRVGQRKVGCPAQADVAAAEVSRE